MIHHLQQEVEDLRVSLLDLIQQQHAMRLLGDGLGQQTALVESDISGRCTDQTRHRVPLHVLGHVEADQLDPSARQLACGFGLAYPCRAGEEEGAHRFVRCL